MTNREMEKRIEALERRVAALAIGRADEPMARPKAKRERSEADLYRELAGMLPGYVEVDEDGDILVCHIGSALDRCIDWPGSPIMQALLIGLACAECNGAVLQHTDDSWFFRFGTDVWGDGYPSQPEAAVKMLTVYRESRDA